MLDKKKKRSASVARMEWPESQPVTEEGGGSRQYQQKVTERKTDMEKLYWGDAGQTQGDTYQQSEVEKFYWNDKVPGGEERAGGPVLQEEQTTSRKTKLNGLREFQNFNDEEKLYWNEKLHQVAVKQPAQPTNNSSSDLSRAGASAIPNKQNGDKLGWNSGGAQGLYRSYFNCYEASRWRPLSDKKQLQSRLAQYCSRPASSLGMAGHPLGSPSMRLNRHRRSSMSYYEDNLQPGHHARSSSMDVLPLNMIRATQFTDQFVPGPHTFYCQETNIGSPQEVGSVTTRQRQSHDTVHVVRTGPGAPSVTSASGGAGVPQQTLGVVQPVNARDQLGGSNEDMKKVLMELDNTGYFAEELMDSSHQVTDTTKQRPPPSLHIQTGQMDYKKLWENSKLHNVQLQKELNEVKSDLESVRSQLETMAIRAVNQKSVSDAEKREKLIVIKKLEGLEKELKLLAYSESLTDQTLNQLRLENNRLREENLALLRVMDKIVKN